MPKKCACLSCVSLVYTYSSEQRLGPERIKMLYAFRTMLDDGARITLGSDFPVEDMNPLSGFYAGITRLSPKGKSPKGNEPW
ncbi:amidohydrolase family protein [Aetokthonos hydrillicola]|uniref:amidohydrolase family protein n=1 Tax=Aetokthonos hydrillicola TaxID=1550245 RepID=UPI001B09C051